MESIVSLMHQVCKESALTFRHCACVLKGKRMVAMGTNNHRGTWKNQATFGIHAEQQAIIELLRRHGLYDRLRLLPNQEWRFLRRSENKTKVP